MRSWKRYGAAAAVNGAVIVLVLCIKGNGQMIYYVDAFGVGGAVSIFLGLLGWVAAAGAFDTIGYGFSIFSSKRRDRDLYEYTVRKQEKRSREGRPYLPFLIVGAVFLALSFVMMAFITV